MSLTVLCMVCAALFWGSWGRLAGNSPLAYVPTEQHRDAGLGESLALNPPILEWPGTKLSSMGLADFSAEEGPSHRHNRSKAWRGPLTASKTQLEHNSGWSAGAVIASVGYALHLGPAAAACEDNIVMQGQSSGPADCESRCDKAKECGFYSIWLTGGKRWCRLTATCNHIVYRQGKSIMVKIYRRLAHGSGSCVFNEAIDGCSPEIYKTKCPALTQSTCVGFPHTMNYPCCMWSGPTNESSALADSKARSSASAGKMEHVHAEHQLLGGHIHMQSDGGVPAEEAPAGDTATEEASAEDDAIASIATTAAAGRVHNEVGIGPDAEIVPLDSSVYGSLASGIQKLHMELGEKHIREMQALDVGRSELEELIAQWQHRNAEIEEDNVRIANEIEMIERRIAQKRSKAEELKEALHQRRADLLATRANLSMLGEFVARSMTVVNNLTNLPDLAQLSKHLEDDVMQNQSEFAEGRGGSDSFTLVQVNATQNPAGEPQLLLNDIQRAMSDLAMSDHESAVDLRSEFQEAMKAEQGRAKSLMLEQRRLNATKREALAIEGRFGVALDYMEHAIHKLAEQRSVLRLMVQRLGVRPVRVSSMSALPILRQLEIAGSLRGSDYDGLPDGLDALVDIASSGLSNTSSLTGAAETAAVAPGAVDAGINVTASPRSSAFTAAAPAAARWLSSWLNRAR